MVRTRHYKRNVLDREIQRIQDEMLVMGSKVCHATLDAVDILRHQNLEAARALIIADKEINQYRLDLEQDCLKLIATQNPIAKDLRTIAAVLEIITELERIHDYAKGIAKVTLRIGTNALPDMADFPHMAVKAQGMLRRSLVAFTQQDEELAYAIAALDDDVDALYNQIYQNLVEQIIAKPQTANQANLLLWAAHNLERTGDRAINICERVIFTITGQLIELDCTEEFAEPA